MPLVAMVGVIRWPCHPMLVVVVLLVFYAEGENGNRSPASFRGGPARALQLAAKKPVCPPGYIDHTGARAWIWRCAEECKGAGTYGAWSDRYCQCACVDPSACVGPRKAGNSTSAGDDCVLAYEKKFDETGVLPGSSSQAAAPAPPGPAFVSPAPSAPGLGASGQSGITGVQPGVPGTAQTNVPTARPVGYQQLGSSGRAAEQSIIETRKTDDNYTVLIVLISLLVVCCVGGMCGCFCFVFMCNNEHVVVQKLKRSFSRAGTGNLEVVDLAQPRAMSDDDSVRVKTKLGQPPPRSPRENGQRASLNVQVGDRPAMSPRGSPKPSPSGSPRPSPRKNITPPLASPQSTSPRPSPPAKLEDPRGADAPRYGKVSPRPSPRAKLEDPRGADAPRYGNSPRGHLTASAPVGPMRRDIGPSNNHVIQQASPRGPRNAGVAGPPSMVPTLDLSPTHSPQGGAAGG